jgi:hypothetical protein
MRLVYIKQEYRDANEVGLLYAVTSEPNANGRVDIQPVVWDYVVPSIESVYPYMLEDAE